MNKSDGASRQGMFDTHIEAFYQLFQRINNYDFHSGACVALPVVQQSCCKNIDLFKCRHLWRHKYNSTQSLTKDTFLLCDSHTAIMIPVVTLLTCDHWSETGQRLQDGYTIHRKCSVDSILVLPHRLLPYLLLPLGFKQRHHSFDDESSSFFCEPNTE